jgi:hypothetical protein
MGMDNERQAQEHVISLLQGLTEEAFSHRLTERMRETGRSVTSDVYGVRDEFCLWYIKVHIKQHPGLELVVCSCHEAEKDITLCDERVLPQRLRT